MTTIMNTQEQYVYVLSNTSFEDDVLKIGWTREHPRIRAINLHTSGIPTPFIIEFVIITNEGSNLEKIIHEHIKQYRINFNREFFKISKDKLKEILQNELNLDIVNDLNINSKKNSIIYTFSSNYYDDYGIKKLDISLFNNKKNKFIYEIANLYINLENNVKQFLDKLKQNNTELRLDELDGKIVRVYVYHFTPDDKEYDKSYYCIKNAGGWDDLISNIINNCRFIEQDTQQHKKTLDILLNNPKGIKESIGGKLFRSDSIYFKKKIIETQTKLNKLLNDYIWEF